VREGVFPPRRGRREYARFLVFSSILDLKIASFGAF